jgi:site-specific DNA recombinase
MPTYFVYSRKSSEAEDRQILSIDSQISELKHHAAQNGIKISEILSEAKSAKAPGRPVFNSMMERLYRGEADGILCWKLEGKELLGLSSGGKMVVQGRQECF